MGEPSQFLQEKNNTTSNAESKKKTFVFKSD